MPPAVRLPCPLGTSEPGHLLRRPAVLAPALGTLGRADRDDPISRLDAGVGGGRSIDRGDHLDGFALGLRDLDPETLELAAGVDLHLRIGVDIHEGRVGIQLVDEAAHGPA